MFMLLSKNRYNDLLNKENRLSTLEEMCNDLIRYYDNVSLSSYRSRYTSIQLNEYIRENGESKRLIEELEGELNSLEQHEENWLILLKYLSSSKKKDEYIAVDSVIDFILDLNKHNL